MNLADLEKIFWNDVREQPVQVRLRRVVEALRDEICKQYGFQKIWDDFDNILGGAGGEKAAGGPTREDGQASQPGSTAPAADPSHAVCEWTPISCERGSCGHESARWQHSPGEPCPSCSKPIAFKETTR